jgi:hypothetical protein
MCQSTCWRRLPDIPWSAIMGEPYIEMFGAERLLSTPCEAFREIGPRHIWLQATASPFEPVPDEVRATIRAHLGEESVMSSGRWRYVDGIAPHFGVSKVIYDQQR